uniref:Uncharacterized protein n=1 Tax=Arundo donax TaxID=35708 RepID=A0A0A9BX42_ARUDO
MWIPRAPPISRRGPSHWALASSSIFPTPGVPWTADYISSI